MATFDNLISNLNGSLAADAKDRNSLRNNFLRGNIPTEDHFHSTINSSLNLIDDGLFKTTDSPLCIKAPSGDAALPVLHFYGGTDTEPAWQLGIEGDHLHFTIPTNGTHRLTINSNGNVGIGTSSPQEALQIGDRWAFHDGGHKIIGYNYKFDGASKRIAADEVATMRFTAEGDILFQTSGADTADSLITFTEALAIRNNGNVGIGTTNPAAKLEVNGEVKATGMLVNGRLDIHPAGSYGGQNRFNGLESETSANGRAQLVLSSSYSDMVIASSQNNPNGHGSTLTFATYDPDNANEHRKWIVNQGNWASRKQFLDFGYRDAISNNPHHNINNTDTLLTLDGVLKNIGIGTRYPQAPLSIGLSSGKESHPDNAMHITNDCILFGGNNNGKQSDSAQISAGKHVANSLNIIGMSSGGTDYSDRKIDVWAEGGLTIRGNVGIGTTSPGAKLDIRDSSLRFSRSSGTYASIYYEGDRQIVLHLSKSLHSTTHRYAVYNGDNNWDFASDQRLKTNITNENDILSRLLKLNVKNYNWKDMPDMNPKPIGFMAQDVKPLFPSLVGEMEDPETKESTLTLKYAGFGVLAVGAIKELKEEKDLEIAALKKENAASKKAITALKKDMAAIKKEVTKS